MATSSRIAPIRGDAPPFDFKQFTRDVVVPSDQALVLDKLPGWFRAASGNVAPIDDTPEEFEDSQAAASTRGGAKSSSKAPTPTSPSVVGRYMAKVRALMMDDDDDDDDDGGGGEEENDGGDNETDAEREAREAQFLVKPAKGVKPLVLKGEHAVELMNQRRVKKPVIIDDDDEEDDEEVIGTQTESQILNAPASPSKAASPKRKRAGEDQDETMASPKRPSIVGRAINAVVGMLSPLRSQPTSPLIGVNAAGLASPGLPNSVLVSPGSMRNIVGNVARSVLDDGETRQGKVEWGSASAYDAKRQPNAKRSLEY